MADRQFAISGKWALAAAPMEGTTPVPAQGRDQMAVSLVCVLDQGHPRPVYAREGMPASRCCPPTRRPAVYLRGMDPETRSDVRRDGFSRRVSPAYPEARRGPPHAANALRALLLRGASSHDPTEVARCGPSLDRRGHGGDDGGRRDQYRRNPLPERQ